MRLFLPSLCLTLLLIVTAYFSWNMQQQLMLLHTAEQHLKTMEFSLRQKQQSFAEGLGKDEQEMSGILAYLLENESLKNFSLSHPEASGYYGELKGQLFQETRPGAAVPGRQDVSSPSSGAATSTQDFQSLLRSTGNLLETAIKYRKQAALYSTISGWLSVSAFISLIVLLYKFINKHVVRAGKIIEKQTYALCEGQEILPAKEAFHWIKTAQEHLQKHSQQQKKLAALAEQIGEGNFSSQGDELKTAGALGKAIGLMQEKVKQAFQDEEKRSWSSEGLAKFSATIRDNSHSMETLCATVLTALVPFVKANQGSIFIKEEEEGRLTQLASYAWGKKKFSKQSYEVGEGLIGQAAQEKDTIFLTDVPDNFITIGSGLGHGKPKCIVILPLIADEVVYGVLELASFTSFENHQLNFLQKLCENLASAIAVARVNSQTTKLLQQAEETNYQLRAQEEMLRQNTEEMMATQEAMLRKEEELSALFTSLNYSQLTAEIDEQGTLSQVNSLFADIINKSESDCIGQLYTSFLEFPGWTKQDYHNFQHQLKDGVPRNQECRLRGNTGRWLSASFTPVKDKTGRLLKTMLLAHDISEKKEAEKAFMMQAEEIKEQEEQLRQYTQELEKLQAELEDKLKEARKGMEQQIKEIREEKIKNEAILEGCVDGVVSFNEKGTIEYFNRAAEDIWEVARMDVLGRNIKHFIPVEIMKEDCGLMVYYSKNGVRSVLDTRTEVPVKNRAGQEMEVLLTLTRVEVEGMYTFTAFAQKVAVELF